MKYSMVVVFQWRLGRTPRPTTLRRWLPLLDRSGCTAFLPLSTPRARRPAGGARGRAPFLSQICSGLLPMEYRIDRKPDWNVFLNIAAVATKGARARAVVC